MNRGRLSEYHNLIERSKQLPLRAWIVLADRDLSNKPLEQNPLQLIVLWSAVKKMWSHLIVAEFLRPSPYAGRNRRRPSEEVEGYDNSSEDSARMNHDANLPDVL